MDPNKARDMEPASEDIRKVIELLPSMEHCTSLELGETEILVTAAGFEDRAMAAAGLIEEAGKGRRALVLNYGPRNEKNKLDDLLSTLRGKGFVLRPEDIVTFDRYNPEIFPSDLQARLKDLNPSRVVVDISAMSKLALLLCLQVCWELNSNTSVFYAEAENKGPQMEEYEQARSEKNIHRPSIQIYTGIHGVIRVTVLSSVAMQGQPSAAIAFMSFNELLTQALLNTVYPSRLFLINGRSPKWPWREGATAWIHELLRSEWPNDDNPLEMQPGNGAALPARIASTLEYLETIRILLGLYWTLAVDHRVLLAPTGSKMQTLGCFFAKALHPDIHIEYPTPDGFLDTYSDGIGPTWLIQFGPLAERIADLRVIERKSLLRVEFSESILE